MGVTLIAKATPEPTVANPPIIGHSQLPAVIRNLPGSYLGF